MLPPHIVKAFRKMMEEHAGHLGDADRDLLLLVFCEGWIAGSEWRLEECRRTLTSHLRALHGTAN